MKFNNKTVFSNHFTEFDIVRQVNFSDEEIDIFFEYAEVENYRRKDFILKQGDVERHFRLIIGGLVRKYYLHDGRELITQFAQKGNIICSYSSYMSDLPSQYAIQCIEDTRLFAFRREDMDKIMFKGQRFVEFWKKISYIVSHQKDLREKELLVNDAIGRLRNFIQRKPDLYFRLPQKFIASYLNIGLRLSAPSKEKLEFSDRVFRRIYQNSGEHISANNE